MPQLSTGFRHPLGNGVLTQTQGDSDGYYVAQDFNAFNPDIGAAGSFHLGEDWNGDGGGNTDLGDPVYAASNGEVTQSGFLASLGNYLVIRHDLPSPITVNGITTSTVFTLYAHLQNLPSLAVGDDVIIGQQIGSVGASGAAGGLAHLHFEIRLGSQFTDADGYNPSGAPAGWVDPTTFINGHRTLGAADDAGDSFETATPVSGNSWDGTVGVGGDGTDFWTLQAQTTGTITLTLSGLEHDVDLFLYDSNQNQLDSSSNEGTANDQVVANVVAGQFYYVHLIPFMGSSTYDIDYIIAAAPAADASSDFQGDGRSDFFLRNANTGGMVMWFNASSASSAYLGAVSTTWSSAGSGDFNGDGRDDILWRNTATGDIASWFMNGQSVIGSAGFGLGTSWNVSGIGDINGDSRDDLVLRSNTGDIVLWFMNGGAVTGAYLGNVSTAWQIEELGDFNGDGRDDFIWRNSATGDMSMWLMNGTAVTPNNFANVGGAWAIAGVGDLNGDGRDDVVWRDQTTGNTSLWFMNGGTIVSQSGFNVATNFSIADVADFNGDGRDDIMWRSTANDVFAWYMNGATVQGSAYIGNLGPDWIINPGG